MKSLNNFKGTFTCIISKTRTLCWEITLRDKKIPLIPYNISVFIRARRILRYIRYYLARAARGVVIRVLSGWHVSRDRREGRGRARQDRPIIHRLHARRRCATVALFSCLSLALSLLLYIFASFGSNVLRSFIVRSLQLAWLYSLLF